MSDIGMSRLICDLEEEKRRRRLTFGAASKLAARVADLETLLERVRNDPDYYNLADELRADLGDAITTSPVNWQNDPDIDWTGIGWAPGSRT